MPGIIEAAEAAEAQDIYHVEWYIPGPIDYRPEVLEAMSAQPYGHRVPELMGPYVESIRKNLFALVNASEDTHSMVLTGGSGTNALEMAARTWGDPSPYLPKVLGASIGLFGDLWTDIFESCDVPVRRLRSDDGDIANADKLHDALANGRFEIVTLTHNDTSTGTVNPLEQLAGVVKNSGALLLVDAVSSVGGIKIDVSEWGIDFLAMAPQKGLGVPPGLALAVVSNEALEKRIPKNRGYTTDLMRQVEENRKNITLTTPPEAQIGALALELGYIMEVEGPTERYRRHSELAEITRNWAATERFRLLPDRANASDTVSCFVNTRGIDLGAMQRNLWANPGIRYGFDAGHPKLAKIRQAEGKPETFRVAHMGDRPPEQLQRYLGAISANLALIT
ncbi:MAG TPA: aminotransferase class V-fold PLP-dependent enzyme [Candidatus Saccharimonadales bacterium]|nr:aminotransferase class V-fold PLP-dependent enzyme [Candidatus Saccharimonadales bacterium]